MSMKLMYITNDPRVAVIAEGCGVDRIFIDLETVGKRERQAPRNTVISDHSIEDIAAVKAVLDKAELLVRVNPVYFGSPKEIDRVCEGDADIIMLPYFKTVEEVRTFIKLVGGRKRICLLFETPEALELADGILSLGGIDEVFIGLNDLHIGCGMRFMFEPLADGTVEKACCLFARYGIPYGFGGIARLDSGALKARLILGEHYRLGSGAVILSRSFTSAADTRDYVAVEDNIRTGVAEIREYESILERADGEFFENNRKELVRCVNSIVEGL